MNEQIDDIQVDEDILAPAVSDEALEVAGAHS